MIKPFDLVQTPSTLTRPDYPATLQALAESADQLFRRLARQIAWLPAGHLVRLQVDAPPVDLVAWLAAQAPTARFYWSGRDDGRAAAGVGTAAVVSAESSSAHRTLFERVAQGLARADTGARFYGGLRFQPGLPPATEWETFGYGRFVAPAFEWSQGPEGSRLAWQFELDSAENRPAQLQRLQTQLAALRPPNPPGLLDLPPVSAQESLPTFDAWQSRLESALSLLRAQTLQKVVLARRTVYHFTRPVLPLALFQRLQQIAPRAFHFYFESEAGAAFLGASPERLYRREGRRIESEALAGTRRRGQTPAEDRDLARDLSANEKERREHRLVLERVRSDLSRLCGVVSAESHPRVMPFEYVQHLYQALQGNLMPDITDADIVQALHPTPAVGGWPRAAALDTIAALELFDRGWYAAPVGWLGQTGAELAVGIRSGLVNGATLTLFAGAGIVPGSSAAAEWQETENKLRSFRHILD